jgi:hypothetical protein
MSEQLKPKAHPLRGTVWFLVLMACAWLVSLVISGTTFEVWNLPFLGFIIAIIPEAVGGISSREPLVVSGAAMATPFQPNLLATRARSSRLVRPP